MNSSSAKINQTAPPAAVLRINTPDELVHRLGFKDYIGKIPTPVLGILESLGYKAYQFDASKHTGLNDTAVMVRHDIKVALVNDAESSPRRRLALAVAIGHVCLHNDNVSTNTDNRSLLELGGGPSDKSIEANNFAVSLLLPEQDLRAALDADNHDAFKLAARFDIPVSILLVRLQTLKIENEPRLE
jgi:Zn-dependent peptidase ImmA (M78 family)